jgi:hypothetical protein
MLPQTISSQKHSKQDLMVLNHNPSKEDYKAGVLANSEKKSSFLPTAAHANGSKDNMIAQNSALNTLTQQRNSVNYLNNTATNGMQQAGGALKLNQLNKQVYSDTYRNKSGQQRNEQQSNAQIYHSQSNSQSNHNSGAAASTLTNEQIKFNSMVNDIFNPNGQPLN